jgi:hypothetical protein
MKTIKIHPLAASIIVSTLVLLGQRGSAQTNGAAVMSTPPLTMEEKEALYNTTVEDRTLKIMTALAMTDDAKSNRVHDAIAAQYHALKARDAAIEAELWNVAKGSTDWTQQRNAMFPAMSQPLHDHFVSTLAKDLTPEQMDIVKDRMTYGKVNFTYNAYCSILPSLTDEDKAKVMDLLKQAREVAMDGGSSGEKTAIFQEYKAQINQYLTSRGFDVVKATQEWSSRAEKKASDGSSNSVPPSQ